MPQGTKIATCCYCGTRAALVLTGQTRHELSCACCGAPLHDLKIMPAPRSDVAPKVAVQIRGKAAKAAAKPARKAKKKKAKKRGMSWFLDEAFDVLEDIFD
ncbi:MULTISPECIES: hypothetical protein [unclassified Marinovum]